MHPLSWVLTLSENNRSSEDSIHSNAIIISSNVLAVKRTKSQVELGRQDFLFFRLMSLTSNQFVFYNNCLENLKILSQKPA